MSETVPNRFIGAGTIFEFLNASSYCPDCTFEKASLDLALLFMLVMSPSLEKPSVPSMAPGTIPTTLTLWGPHSTAKVFVIVSTPALAEAA